MEKQKRFLFREQGLVCGKDLDRAWAHALPAYRMAPHAWNVGGQDDVSVYLIDTGAGLILIDTGYEKTLCLVIDRIWRLGFDPKDIKKILLTHYHFDHTQGARMLSELSGAEIWLSPEDERKHLESEEVPFLMPVAPYRVTNFYDDETPIELGRVSIRTERTPGHTLGATSFFFEDVDEETGERFYCATHGGLGTGPMVPGSDWMRHEEVTPEIALRFADDCERLAALPVDINMASHLNQASIAENLPADLNNYRWFVNDYSWHDMLVSRAEEVRAMYRRQ